MAYRKPEHEKVTERYTYALSPKKEQEMGGRKEVNSYVKYCLDNHVKIRQFIENQPDYGKQSDKV